MKKLLAVLLCFGLCGCATIPLYNLQQGAEVVRVAKADPPDNYQEAGQISVYDGAMCGPMYWGYKGTYEQAVIKLKNKAYQMGADYIQIFTISESDLTSNCGNNIYKISGTAYKKVRNLPSPTPIVNQTIGNVDVVTEKLKTLSDLLSKGMITQADFDVQKKKLLDNYTSNSN